VGNDEGCAVGIDVGDNVGGALKMSEGGDDGCSVGDDVGREVGCED